MKKKRGWHLSLRAAAYILLYLAIFAVPTSSWAAYDAFLKIDTLPGESQDTAHKDWIDLSSWRWGDFTSSTAPGGTMGGSSAPARPDPTLTVTMPVNRASPNLFLFHAMGKRLTKAVLAVRRPGAQGPTPDFLTITFDDFVISSYQSTWSTKDPNLPPIDEITLKFYKVTIEYKDRSGRPVKVIWDYKQNVPR